MKGSMHFTKKDSYWAAINRKIVRTCIEATSSSRFFKTTHFRIKHARKVPQKAWFSRQVLIQLTNGLSNLTCTQFSLPSLGSQRGGAMSATK